MLNKNVCFQTHFKAKREKGVGTPQQDSDG